MFIENGVFSNKEVKAERKCVMDMAKSGVALAVFALVASGAASEWTYSQSNGTMTDGNWTFKVHVDLNQNHEEWRYVTFSEFAYVSGEGTLDMTDLKVNGLDVPQVFMDNHAFRTNNAITEFRCDRYTQNTEKWGWAIFYGCANLTNIVLHGNNGNATKLGASWLSDCPSLKSVSISLPKLEYMENGAFAGCRALETIDIASSSITGFLGTAFKDCSALTNINLCSSKLLAIPQEMFANCPNLKSIHFNAPELRSLGFRAFKGKAALKDVCLESPQLENISDEAFMNCTNLTTVDFGFIPEAPALTNIGIHAFSSCKNLTADIATLVPTSVVVVGRSAFGSCTKLTGKLHLPNIQRLGDGAFAWTRIQDVDLRGPIDNEGWYDEEYKDGVRFKKCNALTNIVFDLPNLTELTKKDFEGVWSLKSVRFLQDPFPPQSLQRLLLGKVGLKDCVIYVSQKVWTSAERIESGCWRGLTDAEKSSSSKPEGCFGMCDVTDSDNVQIDEGSRGGRREAWFVKCKSPYDPYVPKGFFIRVR